MKKSRFTEEQIIGVLREPEAGAKSADLCRQHGMSPATRYKWKSKFSGLEVSGAKRLRALETENAKLKRLVADFSISGERTARFLDELGETYGYPEEYSVPLALRIGKKNRNP